MHPLISAAADGALPDWTRAGDERRAHMGRVADLMGLWADRLGLGADDRTRWRAAGWLHDALHDEEPGVLRGMVDESLADLPSKMLHGPAAAARLARKGVDDEPLLRAITYHTLGHVNLDRMGRALYVADYIEPGRDYSPDELAALRDRMPDEMEEVTRVVAAERIERLLARRRTLRPETCHFWNALVDA